MRPEVLLLTYLVIFDLAGGATILYAAGQPPQPHVQPAPTICSGSWFNQHRWPFSQCAFWITDTYELVGNGPIIYGIDFCANHLAYTINRTGTFGIWSDPIRSPIGDSFCSTAPGDGP